MDEVDALGEELRQAREQWVQARHTMSDAERAEEESARLHLTAALNLVISLASLTPEKRDAWLVRNRDVERVVRPLLDTLLSVLTNRRLRGK